MAINLPELPYAKDALAPYISANTLEHAYYLDYQNRRPDYLGAVIQNLINWDFVNANLV